MILLGFGQKTLILVKYLKSETAKLRDQNCSDVTCLNLNWKTIIQDLTRILNIVLYFQYHS